MAATSPYTPNDYNAVSNYRPYQLPINDIFKAITAQNKFWDDGALRVKTVYDNALNLKLSLEPNREIRKKFMEEAEKQLVKLSSKDLSDPSVQRQGFNIFKPLFQDEGIISDDQASRWIEDVENDIRMAREADNGKAYADSNAMVAMEGVYEFRNAKDRMAGKQYLSNRKSYTPYYDPSKEMADIVNNCKGPSIVGTYPGGETDMYLHTQESSGASPSRLKNCLSAALSQKAKDQIQIDGYASYLSGNRKDNPDGKNYRALRDDYVIYNKGAMDGLTQDIRDIDAKIAVFQGNYNKTKDTKWLDAKKAAEGMKDNYTDQFKNLSQAMAEVSAGNLDFIRKNYGQLAEQIYSNKQLATFAEAFRTDKTVDKYSADAVKLQNQRLLFERDKIIGDRLHDKEMAGIKFGYDYQLEQLKGTTRGRKLDENGNVVEDLVPTNPSFTDKDVQSMGTEKFNQEVASLTTQANLVDEQLFNSLQREYPKIFGSYTKEDFFQMGPNGISAALSYLDTQGISLLKDDNVEKWKRDRSIITTKLALMSAQRDVNEADVRQAIPDAFDRNTITSRQAPVTLSDGTVITSEEVLNALEGKPSTVDVRGISKVKYGRTSTGLPISTGDTGERDYMIGGKLYTGRDAEAIKGLVANILNASNEVTSRVRAKRNEIYGRSMLSIKPGVYATVNNTDKEDPTRNNIKASLGVDLPLENIQIIEKDPETGMATISVKADGKVAESTSFLKERLSQLTSVDKSSFSESGNEVVLRIQSPYLVDKRLSENPLTSLQLTLEKIATSVTNSMSSYANIRPGQEIMQLPITTDKLDANIHLVRTPSGVEYEVRLHSPKTGKYEKTGITAQTTNELLEYLNRASQMSK